MSHSCIIFQQPAITRKASDRSVIEELSDMFLDDGFHTNVDGHKKPVEVIFTATEQMEKRFMET